MALSLRREAFCQEIVAGKRVEDAYVAAGFRPNAGNARTLVLNPEIRARIAQLRGWPSEEALVKIAEDAAGTRQWVLDQLVDNVKRAKDPKKFDCGGANRALELLGKELGMFIDKHENSNTVYAITDKPLSPDEWAAKYTSKDAPDTPPAAPDDRKSKLN